MMYQLKIDSSVSQNYPYYGCVVGYAKNIDNSTQTEKNALTLALLRQTEAQIRESKIDVSNPHIAAWREVYRSFGAKPKHHNSSIEALVSRVTEVGALPDINPVVNLYNKVSLQYMIPVGGEDWDSLASDNVLRFAAGTEPFEILRSGASVVEVPDKGEVVWADSDGVTCRRWNWRQCRRTAITESTKSAYFVFDVLPPFKISTAINAAECLGRDLRLLSDVHFEINILQSPITT